TDLDGDGDVDVVYATRDSYQHDTISWLENPGTLGAPWAIHNISPPDVGATSIALADLDGNGTIDVLAASPGTYSKGLIWFPNLGGGSGFAPMRVIESFPNSAPWSVAVADLDGDKHLDVIAWFDGDYGAVSRFVWLPNPSGTGAFGPEQVLRPGLDTI